MVSAGVCLRGKGRLHFVQEKFKVNADYVNNLLPKLMDNCHHFLGQNFIFQQNRPNSGLQITVQSPDFIDKDAWPPNSPDLNPLDYHVWGWMLDKFNRLTSQPKKNICQRKTALLNKF